MSETETETVDDAMDRLTNNPEECLHLNRKPNPESDVPVDQQEAEQWFAIADNGDVAMLSDGLCTVGSDNGYERQHLQAAQGSDKASVIPIADAPDKLAEKLGRNGHEGDHTVLVKSNEQFYIDADSEEEAEQIAYRESTNGKVEEVHFNGEDNSEYDMVAESHQYLSYSGDMSEEEAIEQAKDDSQFTVVYSAEIQ